MSDLTFDSYQHQAAEFAVYSPAHAVTYPLLGLVGEVGELVEKFLKLVPLPPGFTLPYQLREVVRVGLEAGKLAKRLRDSGGYPNGEEDGVVARAVGESVGRNDPAVWEGFCKEGADISWMLAALYTDLQKSWGHYAQQNLAKLQDRKNRGVIRGSGDDR